MIVDLGNMQLTSFNNMFVVFNIWYKLAVYKILRPIDFVNLLRRLSNCPACRCNMRFGTLCESVTLWNEMCFKFCDFIVVQCYNTLWVTNWTVYNFTLVNHANFGVAINVVLYCINLTREITAPFLISTLFLKIVRLFLHSEQFEPENLCTRTGLHANFHHLFWYPYV